MPATKQRVTKKQLTVPQAADQFERVERELAKLRPQREEAVAVLKAHFEKTGRHTYKDRIAYSETSSLILDQPKVRAYLGKQLAKFQKRVTRRSVTLAAPFGRHEGGRVSGAPGTVEHGRQPRTRHPKPDGPVPIGRPIAPGPEPRRERPDTSQPSGDLP